MRQIESTEQYRLSDVLANLAEELAEAQSTGKEGAGSKFKVKGCSIELGLTWRRNAEAEMEFWVEKPAAGLERPGLESIILTLEAAEPMRDLSRAEIANS